MNCVVLDDNPLYKINNFDFMNDWINLKMEETKQTSQGVLK